MDDWQIEKPLGSCSGTGKKIEYGEQYFAALVETGQGLERRDFCTEYWEKSKPEVYCYWKSRLPHPEEKKKMFVDDEMLMSFFDRLEEETEQEKINFRFVLVLVLMRKKKLKYESSRKEGDREIWQLRKAGHDRELVDVINPELDEQQIEQLSSHIGQILQVQL